MPGRSRGPRARRAASLAALGALALAGCTEPAGYVPEIHNRWRPAVAAADDTRVIAVRQIVFWTKDPAAREMAGYLKTCEVWLKGATEPAIQHFVYDLNQRSPFGFINDIGVTHVWKGGGEGGSGRWERMGAYTLEGAAKALFKRPVKTNCAFDPLEYTPRTE